MSSHRDKCRNVMLEIKSVDYFSFAKFLHKKYAQTFNWCILSVLPDKHGNAHMTTFTAKFVKTHETYEGQLLALVDGYGDLRHSRKTLQENRDAHHVETNDDDGAVMQLRDGKKEWYYVTVSQRGWGGFWVVGRIEKNPRTAPKDVRFDGACIPRNSMVGSRERGRIPFYEFGVSVTFSGVHSSANTVHSVYGEFRHRFNKKRELAERRLVDTREERAQKKMADAVEGVPVDVAMARLLKAYG